MIIVLHDEEFLMEKAIRSFEGNFFSRSTVHSSDVLFDKCSFVQNPSTQYQISAHAPIHFRLDRKSEIYF